MDRHGKILENLDMSYLAAKHLIGETVFAPYYSISINEGRILITLDDDRLEELELRRQGRLLEARSGGYELAEMIAQLYPGAEDEFSDVDDWSSPSTLESLRERYPEAFRHLDMSREAAQKVSREMGVRLETIVDRNSYTYTRLKLRIARWGPGEILARTREATEAFQRWCREMGRDRDAADPYYRREESRTTDELYETVKTALKSLLRIGETPQAVYLSNLTPTAIHIRTEKSRLVKALEIETDSHKYQVVIRPATPEKRRELLETGRYKETPHTEKLLYREVFIGTLRLRQYFSSSLYNSVS